MGGGEAAMPRVLLALPTAAASISPISVGAGAAAVILPPTPPRDARSDDDGDCDAGNYPDEGKDGCTRSSKDTPLHPSRLTETQCTHT